MLSRRSFLAGSMTGIAAFPRAHIAEEVERHDADVVAVDVKADGEGAVGINDQLGRRLATAAEVPSGLQDHAVIKEALGDVGDGRRGQPGQFGNLGAGDGLDGGADGLQGHTLIMVAGAFEIGAGQGVP